MPNDTPVDDSEKQGETTETITVAGVTFSAANVITAVVKIDGREINIGKPEVPPKKVGF